LWYISTTENHLMGSCVVCGDQLAGRQRKYCSRSCKNRSTNTKNQSYRAQQARGLRRKIRLVQFMGGECSICGYGANYSALEFHHRRRATKQFQLDLRSLSNRSWRQIVLEAQKCQLLCSNCHKEIHNPKMNATELKKPGKARLFPSPAGAGS